MAPRAITRSPPVRRKTLFRLFAETIQAVSRRYGANCPWYVMTGPMNHTQTVEIFRAENYYGLDAGDVFIFQQGTLPKFGFDGRILLADKAQIARSPDGHGGCIRALARSGALADMKRRGVEVPRKPDGSADGLIEIALSFALDKEDVAAQRDRIPPLRSGDSVYLE